MDLLCLVFQELPIDTLIGFSGIPIERILHQRLLKRSAITEEAISTHLSKADPIELDLRDRYLDLLSEMGELHRLSRCSLRPDRAIFMRDSKAYYRFVETNTRVNLQKALESGIPEIQARALSVYRLNGRPSVIEHHLAEFLHDIDVAKIPWTAKLMKLLEQMIRSCDAQDRPPDGINTLAGFLRMSDYTVPGDRSKSEYLCGYIERAVFDGMDQFAYNVDIDKLVYDLFYIVVSNLRSAHVISIFIHFGYFPPSLLNCDRSDILCRALLGVYPKLLKRLRTGDALPDMVPGRIWITSQLLDRCREMLQIPGLSIGYRKCLSILLGYRVDLATISADQMEFMVRVAHPQVTKDILRAIFVDDEFRLRNRGIYYDVRNILNQWPEDMDRARLRGEFNKQMRALGGLVEMIHPPPTSSAEIEILRKYGKLTGMPNPHPALTESEYLASVGSQSDAREIEIRRVVQERYERYLSALKDLP